MYTKINLDNENLKDYTTSEQVKILDKLSQVNIFIGPNNSGKSRFLRALFALTKPEFDDSKLQLTEIEKIIENFRKKIDEYCVSKGITSISSVDSNKLQPIYVISDFSEFKSKTYDYISNIATSHSTIKTIHGSFNTNQVKNIQEIAKATIQELNPYFTNIDNNVFNKRNIYIPTLRGLRSIEYDDTLGISHGKNNYLLRTRNDYFRKNERVEQNIFTGLSLYEEVKRLLLGSSTERKKIRNFEKFVGETFFNSQEFTIIPNIDDNVVHVKIGDDEDYPIYNLGDGIQSIIILIYPLFFNEDKYLNVFYEEPDLFLHPGYQRIFLETLSKKVFKDYQFFFTTHSNHFLDMTMDFSSISVYNFGRDGQKFIVDNVKNDDLNLLQQLGVRNSSVFLTNCTIWVEGITDRLYIRKFLELYQEQISGKTYKEDIHFSFVEYGGNNITHFSFLENADDEHPNINITKLCGKLFLITDKDGAYSDVNKKSKKEIRQEKLKEVLGENYYCLEAREIENLLKENIIKAVIEDFENKADDIDFSKLLHSNYKNIPLGKFIEEKVSGLTRKYKSESGTVKNKVEFAKSAIGHLNEFDDLSEEAKELVNKIYNFIAGNN